MPQLDKFTFFPVLTWVMLIIFVLYNVILVTGLPKIYKVLLYRKKKLEYFSNLRDVLSEEHFYLLKTHKKVFVDFISKIKFTPELLSTPIEGSLEVKKELKMSSEAFQKDWLGLNNLCHEFFVKEDFEKK